MEKNNKYEMPEQENNDGMLVEGIGIPDPERKNVYLSVGIIESDKDTVTKLWCNIYDARRAFVDFLEEHGYSYEDYRDCDEYRCFCKLMDMFI